MSKIPIKIKNLLKKYTVDEIIKAVKVNHRRIMYQRSANKPIYTKKKVENIINKYDKKHNKKTLVICHGKVHHKKFKDALLLNRLNIVKPDIVSNAWSVGAMGYLPDNYFDIIIMEHCPLGNPFSTRNEKLWKNLYRILKKGGKIENSSILALYGINVKRKWPDMMNAKEKREVRDKVDKHILKLKFKSIKHISDPNRKGNKITIMVK